jgi:succinate dehydrogenase/fumarate reductase-like Fe-S protein
VVWAHHSAVAASGFCGDCAVAANGRNTMSAA